VDSTIALRATASIPGTACAAEQIRQHNFKRLELDDQEVAGAQAIVNILCQAFVQRAQGSAWNRRLLLECYISFLQLACASSNAWISSWLRR
jgi:hypothetical protein